MVWTYNGYCGMEGPSMRILHFEATDLKRAKDWQKVR